MLLLLSTSKESDMIFSRDDYMKQICTHSEYYGQYMTESLLRYVADAIGIKAIERSKDKHFNDISLERWDGITPAIKGMVKSTFTVDNGGHISDCEAVCLAKQAARELKHNIIWECDLYKPMNVTK